MSLQEYAADSGEAVASTEAVAPSVPTFEMLHTGAITPSLTNPRKTFDQAKLQELANSIKASGVHQPVLVRPLPASRMMDTFQDRRPGMQLPSYELIAGERRLRACRMAGVDEIPAMIKHLTDHQVLECQIVENLQRDDLAPLEEAEGYQALIDATGIAKEDIGERIGRSRTYVYGRLKLLDLGVQPREALREGKIDASRALLIARIPDDKLQLKALAAFTETDYHGDSRMSYRSALLWIRHNVMLKLVDARFNIADAQLVPTAGSCNTCEKRTGASPDLFSDVDAPDLCTDPECFRAKGDAHIQAITDKARARGLEVIEGKEALEVKPNKWNSEIAGYVPLDKDFAVIDEQTKSLRSQLSKSELKGQVKLFVDPHTGEALEVVPRELADKARAKLRPDDYQEDDDDENERDYQAERRKRELSQEYERRWRALALPQLQRLVDDGQVQRFEAPMLRQILWLLATNGDLDGELIERVLQVVDGDEQDQVRAAITAIPDEQLGARICTLLLSYEATSVWSYGYQTNVPSPTPTLTIDSLATLAGVDLAECKAQVQQEMHEEAAEREKASGEDAAPAGKSKGAKK